MKLGLCWVVGLSAIPAMTGCSSSNAAGLPENSLNAGGGFASSGSASPGSPSGSNSSSGSSAAVLPPETKVESDYQSPVSTGNFVWIANPTSGRVAYINSQTFSVQTVQAGDGPTYLAAVPDPIDDVAVVANVVSQDATLLRDHAGTLTTKRFPSTADANSWAVSASGRWAIAWTDATRVTNPDPTQGFQDVAVIDTTGVRPATILAVGYRPVQLAFSKDDSRAYAVTQDGITSIDLLDGTQPTVNENYPLVAAPTPGEDSGTGDLSEAGPTADGQSDASSAPDSPLDAAAFPDANGDAIAPEDSSAMVPDATPQVDGGTGNQTADAAIVATSSSAGSGSGVPDVSFTPDGAYALARTDGLATLNVVALASGVSTPVVLPAVPTDLTVSAEGDFAVAVLRDTATVAILPLPGIVTDPTSFTLVSLPGQIIGRAIIPVGGKSVLLFTTAAPVNALIVLTPEPSPTYRVVTLRAPILAVFPTADAQNAIVLHSVPADAGPGDKGAFSLVPIGSGDLPPKIVSLPATPTAVALAPTSDRALVSVRDDTTGVFGLDLAMMPSFEVLSYTLASPPIAVGITVGSVGAGVDADAGSVADAADDAALAPIPRGYVAQDYSEGRITFVDLQDGSPRTITGFELGASIIGGGSQ